MQVLERCVRQGSIEPTRLRRFSSLAVSAVLLLGLAPVGCITADTTGVATPPVVTGYQPDDLPVPLSFELVENEFATWADIEYQDAPISLRTGQFTYFGDRPVTEIAKWYREQMVAERWSFVQQRNTSDVLRLEFKKAHETCEILLEEVPGPDRRYFRTKLVARLRPSSL